MDEAILAQPSALHSVWQRNPLQLRFFGDHLAGEQFFERLERLRRQGAARLPALEVHHYCLLLGFEGRYRLEGKEKLSYFTARLGDEIAYLKGHRAGFAPHALPADNIHHPLQRIVPPWLPAALLLLLAVVGFSSLHFWLGHHTEQQLAQFHEVIQLPRQTAHISITLP